VKELERFEWKAHLFQEWKQKVKGDKWEEEMVVWVEELWRWKQKD